MTNFTSEVQLSVFTRLSDAESDWKRLKHVQHSNPYQSLSWLNAWFTTIGRKRGLQTVVAVARTTEKTVLILPLALHQQAGIKTLSFLGHQNGNQNTGFWDGEFYSEVKPEQVNSLLADICSQVGADLLSLQNIPETWFGREHPLIMENASSSPSPIFTRSLPADFDTLFRETHSKSSRKNLARKQKHLQATNGYRIVKAETQEDLKRGFEAFLQQRSMRAAAAGIPNVFSEPSARDFLATLLCLRQTDNDPHERSLDLWFLEAGGAIRSTYLCVEQGNTIYAYSNSVAHDEMLPNSPGLILIKEIIEYACSDSDLEVLDLGLGEERYKTAWADPVPLRDCRLAISLKGRLKQQMEVLRTDLKSSIRNSGIIWPVVRRLRKFKAGLVKDQSPRD
jgi:CelD/BcsL family acetyltransferase involved in cellulose biosynthesis